MYMPPLIETYHEGAALLTAQLSGGYKYYMSVTSCEQRLFRHSINLDSDRYSTE